MSLLNYLKKLGFFIVIYIFTVIYTLVYCVWVFALIVRQPNKKFWKVKPRNVYPESLKNPEFGEHKFAKLQDVTLHYVEKEDQKKPLMLFIHGFPEFWYSWRHQIKEFSSDYWVVALDLRGYGESDKPKKISEYHMSKIIKDIKQFIQYLGREKVILVGHDWGGVLVWNFLDHYPEMVERYVIINAPFTHSWVYITLSNPRQFLMSWYCFFFQSPWLPEFAMRIYDMRQFDNVMEEVVETGAFTIQDLEVYKYVFSKTNALTYPLNYYRANCGVISLKTRPPENLPPGLFIMSDKDNYLVTDHLRFAKKTLKRVETKIMKDCDHFVQQTNPIIVNKALRQFLECDYSEIK